jgi:ferredoxin
MGQTMSDDVTPKIHRVRFVNRSGEWTVDVEHGTDLLRASRLCDAPVQTLCNGIGACVQCKVRVVENPDNLSRPDSLEKDKMGNIFHITGERLGCQARVEGPVVIEPLPARLPRKKRVPNRRR